MEKFHEKLKVLRKEKGLTQKSLSNMLNISQGAYAQWENGKREPNFEKLSMLACIFDVSIDFLLSKNLEISKETYLKLKEEKKNLFSVRLKELRLQHGFSQEELAEKIGIKRNSYSDWENGKCKPNYEKLEKIADFLVFRWIGCLGENR